ncbi:MAG: hypothetical protein ACNS62_17315 [Candidatus Cyclobacteriaceae bacterium M3_2C_046]
MERTSIYLIIIFILAGLAVGATAMAIRENQSHFIFRLADEQNIDKIKTEQLPPVILNSFYNNSRINGWQIYKVYRLQLNDSTLNYALLVQKEDQQKEILYDQNGIFTLIHNEN